MNKKELVITLGIFVSYYENGNEERNFMLKVQSLGISHLAYSTSMLVRPLDLFTTSLF